MTACIWRLPTGRLAGTLRGHTGPITVAEFATGDRHFLTASEDGTARLWSTETCTAVTIVRGHTGEIRQAALSPDGSQLFTGSLDGTARLWNAQTGSLEVAILAHKGGVYVATFSPDGSRLLTGGGSDLIVRIWERQSATQLFALLCVLQADAPSMPHLSAEFSPNGSRILTTADNLVRIWDADTGIEIVTHVAERDIARATFSRDGSRILLALNYERPVLLDATTGDRISSLGHHSIHLNDVIFSYDGKWVASAEERGGTTLWDADRGEEIMRFPSDETIFYVASSPNGSRLLTQFSTGVVTLWDTFRGTQLGVLGSGFGIPGSETEALGVAFSPDNRYALAAIQNDEKVELRLWDAGTGSDITTLEIPGNNLIRARISSDGTLLAAVCELLEKRPLRARPRGQI